MNPGLLKRIEVSVHKAQQQGIQLVWGNWGVKYNTLTQRWEPVDSQKSCACLLGCLLLSEQPPIANQSMEDLISDNAGTDEYCSAALEIPLEDIQSIIAGFDKDREDLNDWDEDAVRLREKLNPISRFLLE